MLFVALSSVRAGTQAERIQRRAKWNPEAGGVHFVAEYWLPTASPNVIHVFETDDASLIFEGVAQWDDVFDTQVFPATTAEEGLRAFQQRAEAVPAGA